MIALLRRVPLLETALIVLAIALITALSVMRQQTRLDEYANLDSYSSYDAHSGGYRAWYELLQREGVRVERFEQRPAFLDRGVDTLVWAEPLEFDPRQTQNVRADVDSLENWVKAGGRLVYLGHDDKAAKQKILKLPTSTPAKPRSRAALIAAGLRSLGVESVTSVADLRWKARKALNVLVADRAGALVVSYSYGKGEVVAAIDEAPFTNSRLASGDQARLAYALGLPHAGDGRVAFDEAVHGRAIPDHWWSVLPRALVIAILVACFALLVAFAGAAIRLGPPLVPPRRVDATSGEFIDSMAALFERGRTVHKALDDALRSTTRVVAVALGVPDDTPAAELAARIERPDLRAAYQGLVAAATAERPDNVILVRGIALAQQLRKEFISHGRQRN